MAISNAVSYHTQYRAFSGPTYKSLFEAGIYSALSGWTAPDTGKPSGWTEITSRVHWPGGTRERLSGNAITWEADLSGEDYDGNLLAIGTAVVLWRRYYTPEDGWLAWAREYVGQFLNLDDQDDYRHGQQWRRGVVGSQYNLSRLDSRPLSAGPLDVTTGSTVSAWNSDVLINPVQEADSGEYVGEIANVQPDNIADGKLSTVYISETVPNATQTEMEVKVDGGVILTEVMFAPALGWPQAATWWAQVYNCRNRDGPQSFHLVTARDYDAVNMTYREVHYAGGWPEKLDEGQFGIVCGNRALFELYTGGAPNARFVIDVSRYTYEFTLDPTDGFIGICSGEHDTEGIAESPSNIIWAPDGAPRRAFRGWNVGSPSYDPQYTFDSDLTPAGSGNSIRRIATPEFMGGGGDPDWFELVTMPTPGRHSVKSVPVALQVLLPENICRLTAALTGSSTVVTLDNDVGWFTDGGKGIVESDVFTYTAYAKGVGLTGMTWDNSGSHDHAIGARCYPYAQVVFHGALTWAQQTGYPLTDFYLLRRRPPFIQEGRVYLSYLREAAQFDDETSQPDYDARFFWAGNALQQSRRFSLADPDRDLSYRWVAAILIVFDKMSDGGRAKLNEIWARVAYAQRTSSIDDDGVGITTTGDRFEAAVRSRSADLAQYIYTLAGGAASDFVDQSYVLGHRLGEHRISPVAITRVMSDLAQKTGCLVRYGTDGRIYWQDDPWWPGSGYVPMTEAWTSDNLVGALRFGETARTIDYVTVNALSLESEPPLQVRVTYPPPPNGALEPPVGSQTQEIGGFSVVSETDARFLAESEYRKATLNTQGAATLKGIHDIRPGQLVSTAYDFGLGPTISETWQWQITSVNTQRAMSASGRSVVQTVELRLWGKLAIG